MRHVTHIALGDPWHVTEQRTMRAPQTVSTKAMAVVFHQETAQAEGAITIQGLLGTAYVSYSIGKDATHHRDEWENQMIGGLVAPLDLGPAIWPPAEAWDGPHHSTV